MFSTPLTTRRRRLLLASSMLAPVFTVSLAHAQQPPSETLPPVEISAPVDQNNPRPKPTYDEFSGPRRPAPGVTPADAKPAGVTGSGGTAATGPGGSGGQHFSGIVGTSSSVITANDIAHSPFHTLAEIIAQVPGVQLQSLFGGVNGAKTSVDLRGFGAFATANK